MISENALVRLSCFVLFCIGLLQSNAAAVDSRWQAGFAKVDVTPQEPVRMSGYGSRDHPSEGVETPLFVRVACFRSITNGVPDAPLVLVSVDNVGLSGGATRGLAEAVESKHAIARSRIAFCSTHTHSGPDLGEQLSNIFSKPLTQEEADAARRYRERLHQSILNAVASAIEDLTPASLAYGVGKARFAANRRVLTDGKWTGFGVQSDGPVDHSVPVLRITSPSGSLRGLIFNYACHCTTVGGDYYKINADWAGYAATQLESSHDGAIALCTIGCGADANPDPRGTVELSRMHGQALANEVERMSAGDLAPIDSAAEAHFDYAALSFDLPTREELEERLADSSVQTRRHAQEMIKVYQEKGRLPATYPVPIQSWQFGDQLTMVFLGGEVVVDYALRLKKVLDDPNLWVTAYANDVLGYIASERMRAEGGYEYDRSGIYYGLPGPWASGSEDLLIRRVIELLQNSGRSKPQSADASLRSIRVANGFRVELVAAEPLVQDPINLAFGDDGRLWVVEMGDYPEGERGGRIKALTDVDGDGTFDRATTFLAGLSFPTGVQPWKDGLLVSAAPDVLFARDTDGDGRADQIDKIYSGFPLANPQHRINGFTYGLDHSLHLAAGDNLGEITSSKSGQSVNASGHDVQIWPDSGKLGITSGRTQFVRSRDSFGRWFGNNNSNPMYHYPIDDRYLKRNSSVSYSANAQPLFSPAVAPPVYPLTSAGERFNDLFAANRFTSACSSIVARSPHFNVGNRSSVLICEPVHNLVHRSVLVPQGASFAAERLPAEEHGEFLASTDPWFRPVRSAIGPDGMLYLVDMYREVIEHPEWIPDAWQERLDLRAGDTLGRIYRVAPVDAQASGPAEMDRLSTEDLADQLHSSIGPLRDQAHRLILHRGAASVAAKLRKMASSDSSSLARVHALSILNSINALDADTIVRALSSQHAGVAYVAIRFAEDRLSESPEVMEGLSKLADHQDASVAMRVALALGESESPLAGESIARIAMRQDLDRWMADAIVSSASAHGRQISKQILLRTVEQPESLSPVRVDLLRRVLATSQRSGGSLDDLVGESLASMELPLDTRLRLAECVIAAAGDSKSSLGSMDHMLGPLCEHARRIANDTDRSDFTRCRAISLLSYQVDRSEEDTELLLSLLHPATPVSVQCEAIDGLLRQSRIHPARKVIQRWPSFSIAVRHHLTSELLSRPTTGLLLLQSLESGKIGVNEIPLSAREQLLKSGSRSMRVQAARLISGTGATPRDVLVRQYLAKFASNANQSESNRAAERELGAELFQKHCATCHSTDPSAVAIGASLSNLSNRTDEALVESILHPNRSVEPKFQSFLIQTDEGRTLVGVIESEFAGSLTLAHADGKRTTVRRDQIETIRSTGTSLMPEGFEAVLRPSELQAIVRFLQR
jgi:putative membrane-bound dehydrogenase-like protein